MKKLVYLSSLLILFASCGPPKAKLSREEMKEIAKEAYIFGYPYVLEYRTMYMQAVDEGSGSYVGFGKFLHYGATTPKNKDIVTPNRDTPYSWAWVDLRSEPWVLTVPAIDSVGHRYYTSQWNDLSGFVLDNVSSLTDGYDGGNYLLAPPDWSGELPQGIKRAIKGETYFLSTLTRTELLNTADTVNVKKIQQGYKLQSLSQFLGQPAPTPAPAINFFPYEEGIENKTEFFDCLSFLLQFSQPNLMDKPILDRMVKINIKPGTEWSADVSVDSVMKNASREGLHAALDTMIQISHTPRSSVDHVAFGNREVMKTNYLERAMGAFMGLFGNVSEQAFYASWGSDNTNEPIDASKHNYIVTFKKGELPDYKFFWSITMYDLPGRFLVDNPINRYSIGSRTKDLKYNQDGSLTIYIQHQNPGKGKESNWLPAPNSPFFSVIRFYGPGESILNGTWKIPPITKVN